MVFCFWGKKKKPTNIIISLPTGDSGFDEAGGNVSNN